MEFFFLINIYSFVRLFFFFKDRQLTFFKLNLLSVLQLIPLLLFEFNLVLFVFAILIILINVLSFSSEKKYNALERMNLIRFLTIAALTAAAAIFTSPLINVRFSNFSINIFTYLHTAIFPALSGIQWHKINIISAGGLLLLNEANFFIRYFFDLFGIIPREFSGTDLNIDEKEYSAGRVIGMLERVLIYFFVLIDQYAAIGFIIAAKGFTRFKEMDEREFAEYVLIGTLLSATTSIFTAVIVKEFLLNG